ncbi:hypothetical protein KCP74_05235 [Salmonella enterica subsp. enterica]|nr:hypothetical protein KCP74_05235 [Salmonella enterica subsp. enterica]
MRWFLPESRCAEHHSNRCEKRAVNYLLTAGRRSAPPRYQEGIIARCKRLYLRRRR